MGEWGALIKDFRCTTLDSLCVTHWVLTPPAAFPQAPWAVKAVSRLLHTSDAPHTSEHWLDRRSQQRTVSSPVSVIAPMVHFSNRSKDSSRNQNHVFYVNALQNITQGHILEVVL